MSTDRQFGFDENMWEAVRVASLGDGEGEGKGWRKWWVRALRGEDLSSEQGGQ